MDVGGGLDFSDSVTGLSVDVRMRTRIHKARRHRHQRSAPALGTWLANVRISGPVAARAAWERWTGGHS